MHVNILLLLIIIIERLFVYFSVSYPKPKKMITGLI